MCGDGFESARAYGEGAAGGDAAFYPAKVEDLFFFFGRGEPSSEGRRPESESKPKVCEQARPQLSKPKVCVRAGRTLKADDLSRGGDL